MSETSIPPVPKLHQLNNNSNNNASSFISNKSPNKPTFSTIKNFLKNKSSLTELKVWSDSKKDDNKDREIPSTHEHTYKSGIHESTSTSKLSEFKLKVPKKKRSLGSLIPQLHNEVYSNNNNNDNNDNNIPNNLNVNDSKLTSLSFNNSTGNILEPKSYIIPLPTTQKFTSVASSPQFTLFKHSTGTSKSSSKNVSPTKATFTLDSTILTNEKEPQYTPSTPNMNDNLTFTKEWVAPSTIRGTYLHDWTNNSSPRSLTESMKVGKVETPSINMNTTLFQSPSRNNIYTNINYHNNSNNHNNNFSESSISQSSATNDISTSSGTLLSQFDSNKKKELNLNELRSKMKIDLRDLVEPSNPHPSPYNFETDEESILNLSNHIMKSYNNRNNIMNNNEKSEQLEENSKSKSTSKSDSTTDSDLDSILSQHSQGSQGSQFSFLRNRTSSVRFYKSNEQVELEKAMDEDKLDQLRIKEFIGTSQDIENDLLEVCSRNSKVVDGFDESVNYVDYEEEDDTDVLFNRDLFGLGESKSLGLGLELDLKDSSAPRNLSLEIDDDHYDDNISNLEIGNIRLNDYENKNDMITEPCAKGLELESNDDANDRDKLDAIESSKDIVGMLNKNESKIYLKPKNCKIQIKHRPSAKLQRHRSIKFHQLSSTIEDLDIFDKNYGNNEIKNDFQEEIWEDSSALDEVNQIPEDYEYDGYEDEKSFQCDFDKTTNNESHHLWKNLIRKNSDCSINNRNKSTKQIERIHLDNCTITLFDNTNNDIVEQTNDEELTSYDDINDKEEDEELSTILE